MSIFPFALLIDRDNTCSDCMDCVLVNHPIGCQTRLLCMTSKTPCIIQGTSVIDKVNTCFVILSHSISSCFCSPVNGNSPWWGNIFYQSMVKVIYLILSQRTRSALCAETFETRFTSSYWRNLEYHVDILTIWFTMALSRKPKCN